MPMLRDIKECAFPSDVMSHNLQHLVAIDVKEDVLKFSIHGMFSHF